MPFFAVFAVSLFQSLFWQQRNTEERSFGYQCAIWHTPRSTMNTIIHNQPIIQSQSTERRPEKDDVFRLIEKAHKKKRPQSAREQKLTVASGEEAPTKAITVASPPTRKVLERSDAKQKAWVTTTTSTPTKRSPLKKSNTHKSPGIEAARRRARQLRRRKIMAWSFSMLLSTLSVAIGFFGYEYGAQYIDERDELIRQSVRDTEFEPILENYRYQIDDLRSEEHFLQDRLKRVQAERDGLFAVSQTARALQEKDMTIIENNGMTEQLQQQVAAFQAFNDQYTKGIAQMSKQMLLEKFGRGPYRVEMQVAFTGKEHKLREGPPVGTVVLEMATADEMPHTVYMFLSRVIGGLYNGCSFYHNAGHVIVAGAVPNALSPSNVDVRQRFVDAGLDRVHFQEYSESWPHLEWTVGLAGRPGGTEFYINKRDNSADHGPKEQSSYEDRNGDPCFAKVVRGFDIVDRMQSFMDGTNSDRRVAILSASVI